MRHVIILAFGLAIAVANVRAEEPSASSTEARALMEKAVETMGGAAAIDAVQGMTMKTKGTYSGMPYTSEVTWLRDGRMLWKLDAGVFQASMGMEGDVAWSQFMAPPARLRGAVKRSMDAWRDHQQLFLLRPVMQRT